LHPFQHNIMKFPIFERIDPREIEIRKRELEILRARRKRQSRIPIVPEISGVLYTDENENRNIGVYSNHQNPFRPRLNPEVVLHSTRKNCQHRNNKVVGKKDRGNRMSLQDMSLEILMPKNRIKRKKRASRRELSSFRSSSVSPKKNRMKRRKRTKQSRSLSSSVSPKTKLRPHSSKYTGVSFQKKARKWTARLTKPGSGRKEYLGLFETEEEAALKVLQMAQQWGKELRTFIHVK